MNLLYKNRKIIKDNDVVIMGKKSIKSSISKPGEEVTIVEVDENKEQFIKVEQEIKSKLIEAEKQYEEIIKSANQERFELIEGSKNKALEIEKNAYEQGHSQGIKNGYEDGYKEAYEDNIEKANLEASKIIKNANDILFKSKEYVIAYMKENKEGILSLSVSIAEQVLRDKFSDISSMNNILINTIEEYKLKENIIVKVNPLYKENLDMQIIELKENYKVNGDVFILGDESLKQGNAVIDTLNGRIVIGIDSALDKIKEELL